MDRVQFGTGLRGNIGGTSLAKSEIPERASSAGMEHRH